tara:strand:- start:238 stop:474 length:237 start_codon:yes stop_codon:yes gene_type:complete
MGKSLKETSAEVLSEIPMFTSKSEKVIPFILKGIDRVDEDLSITDFALAVTKIVEQEYGSHLYADFFKIVKIKMQKAT